MSILTEAEGLVHGDRNESYGHPLDNHGETAVAFSAYLRRRFNIQIELEAEDVCWFHVFEKGIRDANQRKRDNPVDTAGYAENIGMIQEERAKRASDG